jgi:hypothetical protein
VFPSFFPLFILFSFEYGEAVLDGSPYIVFFLFYYQALGMAAVGFVTQACECIHIYQTMNF